MKLPQYLTTVTPLSKILALLFLVLLPFVGFYFGNKYCPNPTASCLNKNASDLRPNTQSSENETLNDFIQSHNQAAKIIESDTRNLSKWYTYENRTHNFSFRYPNLVVFFSKYNPNQRATISGLRLTEDKDKIRLRASQAGWYVLSIYFFDNKEMYSQEEWYEKNWQKILTDAPGEGYINKKEDYIVEGSVFANKQSLSIIPTDKFIDDPNMNGTKQLVFLNEKVLYFEASADPNGYGNIILSTLRFDR